MTDSGCYTCGRPVGGEHTTTCPRRAYGSMVTARHRSYRWRPNAQEKAVLAARNRRAREEHEPWTWICEDCGDGAHLEAWASGLFNGKLSRDGKTVEESWTEQPDGVHVDSIQCTVEGHADSRLLHRLPDGRYGAWRTCTWARVEVRRIHLGAAVFGSGRFVLRAEASERCALGRRMVYSQDYGRCPCCNGDGGHYVPVDEVEAWRGCEPKGEPDAVELWREKQAAGS